MKPFLWEVAQKIHDDAQGSDQLQHIAVIVPGKRAGLFLKKHLAEIYQRPLFPPQIFILPDWFKCISGKASIATFESILLMYEVYAKEIDQSEAFQLFMKWAPQAMNDFNDVDQGLVDARQIFQNIKDIKGIEQWSLQSEPLSDIQNQFLAFWEQFGKLYHFFQTFCDEKQQWNYAQLTRRIAEGNFDIEIPHQRTYAVGLSSLTAAEEKIFDRVAKKSDLIFCWDVDQYYFQNPQHEAGQFFRSISTRKKITAHDCLSQAQRNIKTFQAQTAYGNTIQIAETIQQLTAEERSETAVIMTEANLLQPLLSQLDIPGDLNVAMGWPIRNTAVYQLCHSYWEFAKNTQKQQRIYHRDFNRFIEQPAIRFISEPWRDELQKTLIKKRLTYFQMDKLNSFQQQFHWKDFDEFLKYFDVMKVDAVGALHHLDALLQIVALHPDSDAITKESAFQLKEKLRYITTWLQQMPHLNDLYAVEIIFQHLLGKELITFEGEPLEGLQILGMIETRALDFERIIFIQATEDVMPGSQPYQSLIPYDLRVAFQMPLPRDRDASYAYNFYRLLQRAEEIQFYLPSSTSDFRSVERSRYLQQLQWEWPKANTQIQWNQYQLNAPKATEFNISEWVDANDFSRQQLLHKMASGISPSAINKYLQCPLDFYYRYVIGLGEIKEMEEQLDSATIGSLVHKVLENWHFPTIGRALTLNDIQLWTSECDLQLANTLKGDDPEMPIEGYNLLALEAAKKMIEKVLHYDAQLIRTGTPPTILHTEKTVSKTLQLPNGAPLILKGNIDRVHAAGGAIFILDYKTGQVKDKDLLLEEVSEDGLFIAKKAKLIQLLIYAYLSHHDLSIPLEKMKIGLFPLSAKEYEPAMLQQSAALLNIDFMRQFEEWIIHQAERMLETERFIHQEEAQYCQFCRETED